MLLDTIPNKHTYTVAEVASFLSVTRQSVYKAINDGFLQSIRLRGVKTIRIPRTALLAYIDSSTHDPNA